MPPQRWRRQTDYAVRGYCDLVIIGGQRGKKEGDSFYPSDWMQKVSEEKEETMSEEAVSMVNKVTARDIVLTQAKVQKEFDDWLPTRDPDYHGPGAEPYNGYYANFFIILPGWSRGGYLTEEYDEKGWLDIPQGQIYDEPYRSELYRNMTRRLFTGIIYAAIEVESLSLEKIFLLNNASKRDSRKLAEYCMPVLVRLRAMGFIKSDLWH